MKSPKKTKRTYVFSRKEVVEHLKDALDELTLINTWTDGPDSVEKSVGNALECMGQVMDDLLLLKKRGER